MNNMGKSMEGSVGEKIERINDVLAKTQLKYQIRDWAQLSQGFNYAASGASTAYVTLPQRYRYSAVMAKWRDPPHRRAGKSLMVGKGEPVYSLWKICASEEEAASAERSTYKKLKRGEATLLALGPKRASTAPDFNVN